MLKRELKINRRGFFIWAGIIVVMFVVVFLVYPSIAKSEKDMMDLVAAFPKELLEVFNMDIINIGTAFGWIATEGYMMVMIMGGCYFAIMGSTIILKEEDEGTISFLYTKPISRNQILDSKLLCGLIYIILFNMVIGLTSFIGLSLSGPFEFKDWLLISIAPLFLHLFFFTLSLLLSIYYKKTRKSMMISIGVVIGTYIIQILSTMTDSLKFLKYFSPYEYINARDIVLNHQLNYSNILILSMMTVIILIGLYDAYNKKELNA
ncbi:MAG: ABC transporter permease subunit [Bacilli bacterium]|nr:ABC transporter permease subunit [Bacilli bacterium]MDD4808566.1 ABC transporter permease subunit [Bacilli bacterium]